MMFGIVTCNCECCSDHMHSILLLVSNKEDADNICGTILKWMLSVRNDKIQGKSIKLPFPLQEVDASEILWPSDPDCYVIGECIDTIELPVWGGRIVNG